MQNTIIAVDISKNVFEVAVSRRPGVVAERHRLSRRRFLPFMGKFKPTTILLEACGTAHPWARQLQVLGHNPILLPAHDTRRYVLRDKTDQADAKALLEAHRNEKIKPVPVKSIEHQEYSPKILDWISFGMSSSAITQERFEIKNSEIR